MVRIRNMLVLLVCLCVSMGALTACGVPAPAPTPTPTLLSPETIAQYVGAHYQDPHPQVSKVIPDRAEPPPHEPIYGMVITGHFQKGKLVASTLEFSAAASRMYVWAIYAYDQKGVEIWFDRDLTSVSS